MKAFWDKHWDKIAAIFFSAVLGGVIGFSTARIGIIDRISTSNSGLQLKIDNIRTSLEEKIDKTENKISDGISKVSDDLSVTNQKLGKIGGIIEVWGKEKSDDRTVRRELIRGYERMSKNIQELENKIDEINK